MPIIFDLQKDIRFKQGLEKGIEQGLEQNIKDILELKFGSESFDIFSKVDSIHDFDTLSNLRELAKKANSLEEIISFLKQK